MLLFISFVVCSPVTIKSAEFGFDTRVLLGEANVSTLSYWWRRPVELAIHQSQGKGTYLGLLCGTEHDSGGTYGEDFTRIALIGWKEAWQHEWTRIQVELQRVAPDSVVLTSASLGDYSDFASNNWQHQASFATTYYNYSANELPLDARPCDSLGFSTASSGGSWWSHRTYEMIQIDNMLMWEGLPDAGWEAWGMVHGYDSIRALPHFVDAHGVLQRRYIAGADPVAPINPVEEWYALIDPSFTCYDMIGSPFRPGVHTSEGWVRDDVEETCVSTAVTASSTLPFNGLHGTYSVHLEIVLDDQLEAEYTITLGNDTLPSVNVSATGHYMVKLHTEIAIPGEAFLQLDDPVTVACRTLGSEGNESGGCRLKRASLVRRAPLLPLSPTPVPVTPAPMASPTDATTTSAAATPAGAPAGGSSSLDHDADDSAATGAMVGLGVGCTVLAVLLALAVWYIVKLRSRSGDNLAAHVTLTRVGGPAPPDRGSAPPSPARGDYGNLSDTLHLRESPMLTSTYTGMPNAPSGASGTAAESGYSSMPTMTIDKELEYSAMSEEV